MKKIEILKKANYIQFPYHNKYYVSHFNSIENKSFLPIIHANNILYENTEKDIHHYTTYYHMQFVLPIIANILKIPFSINHFNIIQCKHNKSDYSYLYPKNKIQYSIQCFTYNSNISNCNYDDLFSTDFWKCPQYRTLYRYPHACSKIINCCMNSTRKLFISCDSQMIPSIAPLTLYFKEIWIFDNRTGWKYNNTCIQNEMIESKIKSFENTYINTYFTDVLISLYSNPLKWYIDYNLR